MFVCICITKGLCCPLSSFSGPCKEMSMNFVTILDVIIRLTLNVTYVCTIFCPCCAGHYYNYIIVFRGIREYILCMRQVVYVCQRKSTVICYSCCTWNVFLFVKLSLYWSHDGASLWCNETTCQCVSMYWYKVMHKYEIRTHVHFDFMHSFVESLWCLFVRLGQWWVKKCLEPHN